MTGGEGEGAEPADGWSDDGVQFYDAEVVEEGELGVDEIGNVEVRKTGAEGLTGFGIDGSGAG